MLSSGGPRTPGIPTDGDRLKEIAIQRGIPGESIMITVGVRNTAAEAAALAVFAARLHWKHVLLVTSASHMPRAMRLFRQCPAEIVPVPVAYQTPARGVPSADFGLAGLLPQAEALAISERALREYLGLLFYLVSRP